MNINWFQPFNSTDANHVEASMTKLQFSGGWFANPIFVNGQYPDVMREKVQFYILLEIMKNNEGFFSYRLIGKVPHKDLMNQDYLTLLKRKNKKLWGLLIS